MTNKELTFDEQRELQLEILNEIDDCCNKYGIRYSLAFGTLLGAIRHKGYIPWDDDLDIMMPYRDMIRLRDSLNSNDIYFHDVDTDITYGNAFGNICSLKTFRKIGRSKERGLGIDVYPIVKLPNEKEVEDAYFVKANKLQRKRERLLRLKQRLLKYFNDFPVFGYSNTMQAFRNHLVSYDNMQSNRYYIIAGPLSRRDALTYDFDLFERVIEVEFEGRMYKAIADYDFSLSKSYGDYMQLPPVEERVPHHGQTYYWY